MCHAGDSPRPPRSPADPREARASSLPSNPGSPQLAPEARELVVYLDGRVDNAGTLDFAAGLAGELAARLIGVLTQPPPLVSQADTFARGPAIREVIETAHERLAITEGERLALFEHAVGLHSLEWEWRPVGDLPADDLALHARYADLAVVARAAPGEGRVSPPGLVESLVLTAGPPIVVLPPCCSTTRIRRILVSWNAGREATRAVAGAMPLLTKADVVEVLIVDHRGDAPRHGQEPGADIARHLARHGVPVEVRRLPAGGQEVGRVMLSRAADIGADLVVMGAYGHSRLSEWVFGGVTRTVLQEGGLPVLMST